MFITIKRLLFNTFVSMKQIDYIIVGCGLASIAFCEQLRSNNKTFIVFDDGSQQSSKVAAGLYNPVILKRFTPVWKAKEQLSVALPLYKNIEKDLNIKIDHKIRVLRRLASIEEQNLWFNASDKSSLEPYLSTRLIKNDNPYIKAPFGFGEVLQAGWLDTVKLIDNYRSFLDGNSALISKTFDYDSIQFKDGMVSYRTLMSKNIVFAEGFGVKQNPYFGDLPLNGTKGDVLSIKAPDLNIDYAVKSSVFVIPKGDDIYTVGSTYNWEDKTNIPTDDARQELLSKLKSFISCNIEVVNHVAGIRPTVKDRRPLVGRHPKFKNLFVLNGLGTRGVMIAPYVAEKLYSYIENGKPLNDEINISRFY